MTVRRQATCRRSLLRRLVTEQLEEGRQMARFGERVVSKGRFCHCSRRLRLVRSRVPHAMIVHYDVLVIAVVVVARCCS